MLHNLRGDELLDKLDLSYFLIELEALLTLIFSINLRFLGNNFIYFFLIFLAQYWQSMNS